MFWFRYLLFITGYYCIELCHIALFESFFKIFYIMISITWFSYFYASNLGDIVLTHCSLLLFSLVQVQNQSFGPKQNAKLTVDPPTHLPITFRRVLGFVRGQDSVCRLHIDQRAITPNFAPYLKVFDPPSNSLNPKDFGPKKNLVWKKKFW